MDGRPLGSSRPCSNPSTGWVQRTAAYPASAWASRSATATGPEQRAVLVVCEEDNPINALLMKEIIDGMGRCHLLLADNGVMALQQAQKHRPDLLLSDIHMAKMNGITLVARRRADPEWRPVRCIAMSGDAQARSRESALHRRRNAPPPAASRLG